MAVIFVSVMAFIVYVIFLIVRLVRYVMKWDGHDNRTTGSGVRYYWIYIDPGVNPRKRRPGQCEFSLKMRMPFTFTIEREDDAHKLAQARGFTNKLKTGDAEFDEKLYIASDDAELNEALQQSSELRWLLLNIFRIGSVQTITSLPKKIKVMINPHGGGGISREVADRMAEDLQNFCNRLMLPLQQTGRTKILHHYIWRRRLFNFPIISSPILGPGLWLIMLAHSYTIRQQAVLTLYSMLLALILILAFIMLIRWAFRRSAMGYQVIRHFMVFGIIGTLFYSYTLLHWVDTHFDTSQATVYNQHILNKYATYSKQSYVYHVVIQDWHTPEEQYDMVTSQGLYLQVAEGGNIMKLTMHPGFLGCEWIESEIVVAKQ